MQMNKLKIDSSWTLFLDRDGVINKKIENGYVLSVDDLEFLPDIFSVFPKLSKIFNRIIVVTNQQCIGKKILTLDELKEIHTYVLNLLELNGGRLDAIYYAPDLAGEGNTLRKPNNGMAWLAKEEFPEIDFTKSLMIGDSNSDMEFGKSLAMTTILFDPQKNQNPKADFVITGWKEIFDCLESV